jgi:hypothetical protein
MQGTVLTWIPGDDGGGAAEVAGAPGRLALLPVTVEGDGGVREHGVGLVARAAGQDGAALRAGATRVVHGLLDDRVRHRRLRHAPERLPGPRLHRRRQGRRVHDRRLERAAAGPRAGLGRTGHHDDRARRHRSDRRVRADLWRVRADFWRVRGDLWRIRSDLWWVRADLWRVWRRGPGRASLTSRVAVVRRAYLTTLASRVAVVWRAGLERRRHGGDRRQRQRRGLVRDGRAGRSRAGGRRRRRRRVRGVDAERRVPGRSGLARCRLHCSDEVELVKRVEQRVALALQSPQCSRFCSMYSRSRHDVRKRMDS